MTADTRRFLNAAGEFLRADPARNTVILTVTEDLSFTPARRRLGFTRERTRGLRPAGRR